MKIDLHTHSVGSVDGGLGVDDYRRMLEGGGLHYVAITDHGTIESALAIKEQLGNIGERIIIGEEIKTTDGELIGLYLDKTVPEHMSPSETVDSIRSQGGLVYVPHPFETVRSGISESSLVSIINEVDMIEVHNGRAYFQNMSVRASEIAEKYQKIMVSASDAHGRIGWGRSAVVVSEAPTRGNILNLLKNAKLETERVGIGIMYPKLNRLKKKISRLR